MRPNITIIIPEPYLPLDEYCRRTGTNKETARNLIEYGKLPIKPKGKTEERLSRSQHGRAHYSGFK